MANLETFVVTVGAVAVNLVTGTATAPSTPTENGHKGKELHFQCQHATAKVKVGGPDVLSLGGIQLQTNFGVPHIVRPSGPSQSVINAADWWLVSDTGDTTVIVELIKSI